MSMMLFLARLLSPDFRERAKKQNAVQVITISFSHYCELSIWALRLAKVKFQEYGAAPLQHILAVLSIRVAHPSGQKFLSKSSRVTKALPPNLTVEEIDIRHKREADRDQESRVTAVPVAVCPGGKVLKDSWEIANYSGLESISPELKTLLDEEIGPLSRQIAYSFILKPQHTKIWNALCTDNRHWLWKLVWYCGIGSIAKGILNKVMLASNTVAIQASKQKLRRAVDSANAIVEQRRGKYLAGDKPGIGDIALAALLAPVLLPPAYYGGAFTHLLDQLMRDDVQVRDEVQQWRSTAAGEYAMQIYDTLRLV